MGTTPLRRFLQSLCNNSSWNYAVFWKLQQPNQMVLMWEDGYFGTSKVQDSMENTFAETSAYNRTFGENTVELAMAYMSTINYALGDGVVGDVAYTGNCRWVYGNFNTASNLEHADEWLFQFAAGVKTVLLVPVMPHGVLQLGSLEDLPEDTQMANYIKDEFLAHQDFSAYTDSYATMMKSMDESETIDDIIWSNHKPLTKNATTSTSDSWYSSHSSGPIESVDPLHQYTNLINSELPMKQQSLVSDVVPFLNFPKECELHKALAPTFMGKPKPDNSFQHVSVADSSCSKTKTNGMVVGSSSGQLNINEEMGFEGSSSFVSDDIVPAFCTRVKSHNNSSSPSAVTYESVVEELTEEEGQKRNYDVLIHSKGLKASLASKKRVKQGAKPKARPRDRQLIQDRLKDLRELVPDGAKCSIDGLLDRTVKHMLFLESVNDRAVKLRQWVQSEKLGSDPKNNKTAVTKDSKKGASWAVELGGDSEVCPILVEDLQHPGHMVIEMVCEDSIRFLEIAEVIQGLELKILHGVTEKRSGNTWARYIVEAPQGFHRLDIFWPLMKLLQHQSSPPPPSPISSKI